MYEGQPKSSETLNIAGEQISKVYSNKSFGNQRVQRICMNFALT